MTRDEELGTSVEAAVGRLLRSDKWGEVPPTEVQHQIANRLGMDVVEVANIIGALLAIGGVPVAIKRDDEYLRNRVLDMLSRRNSMSQRMLTRELYISRRKTVEILRSLEERGEIVIRPSGVSLL